MRRFFSVVLFVLGAWMLSGELTFAFFDLGEGNGLNLAVLAVMLLFGCPSSWLELGSVPAVAGASWG